MAREIMSKNMKHLNNPLKINIGVFFSPPSCLCPQEEQELASQPAALPYTLHSTDSQLPTIQLGDLFQ